MSTHDSIRHLARSSRIQLLKLNAAFVVLVAVTFGALGYFVALQTAPSLRDLPPCTNEEYSDVMPCLWEANKRGNQIGVSYVMEGDGSIWYVQNRD